MQTFEGQVSEILLDHHGATGAWIACGLRRTPNPGQYLFAWATSDNDAPAGLPLFPVQVSENGFLAAPPIPPAWSPGTRLNIRGPLGRGFELPASTHRLALAALGDSVARLLTLAAQAAQNGCAIALFADAPFPSLPASYEAYPSSDLPESLVWADVLAIDLPLQHLVHLRKTLGIAAGAPLPCPAQVLIQVPMPCAGLAECGACAVPARRGYQLACKDGPVFDLKHLEW
jgi:dihydroorotate dehydrogenase electron transfer subunit